MDMMKLCMTASAFAALVGCTDVGTNGTPPRTASNTSSQSATPENATSQNTTPQNATRSPATEYRPYICDQGGEHNC
jgi:hypothetical protein